MHRRRYTLKESKIVSVFLSILSGVMLTVICLILIAVIMVKIDVSDGLINILTSFVLCAGCYNTAYQIAIKRRRSGLITGIISGIIIFAIMFLISIIFLRKELSGMIFSKLVIAIVCSAIGGIKGVNSKIKL